MWSMFTPSMRKRDCHLVSINKHSKGRAHHTAPLSIQQILFVGTPDALRPVQTEQTVVELSHDILRRKEIVEHPLFPERVNISPEDGCSVWSESPWLVDRDKNVF